MFALMAAASVWNLKPVTALDTNRAERFLPEERRIIEEYYHKSKKAKQKGLPPGLAKRGGNLPPGLQKKLDRDGKLPPGLQNGCSRCRLIWIDAYRVCRNIGNGWFSNAMSFSSTGAQSVSWTSSKT